MVKRHLKAKIWEFVIVVVIILLVLYRFAWLYNYVPAEYLPNALLVDSYDKIKALLIEESTQNTIPGHLSGSILNILDSYEKSIRDMSSKYRLEQATAERCNESAVFRFFMYMGEDANPNCTENNLQVNKAGQGLNNQVKPDDKATQDLNNQAKPAN